MRLQVSNYSTNLFVKIKQKSALKIFHLVNVNQFLNQHPARTATAARAANIRNFFDRFDSICFDNAFNLGFRYAETSANQDFLARKFFDL